MLARFDAIGCMRCQKFELDSLRILEGILELKGELGPRNKVLQVPGERAVETRLVLDRRPATGAVWPGTDAVYSHIGERVWVVDCEDHGDVAGLNAVNNEVGELERVAGELLAEDVKLSGGRESEDGGEEERNVCDEDVGELHGDSVVWCCLFGVVNDEECVVPDTPGWIKGSCRRVDVLVDEVRLEFVRWRSFERCRKVQQSREGAKGSYTW
jgi:hypothetical protein